DNATVDVTGSAAVTANSSTDADALAQGANAGALSVGISQANVAVLPDVDAHIGKNAHVTAGQDIQVNASHGTELTSLPAISTLASAPGGDEIATASATGSIGDLLGGVQGSGASVQMTPTVTAFLDNGAVLTAGNDVILLSVSRNNAAGLAGNSSIALL